MTLRPLLRFKAYADRRHSKEFVYVYFWKTRRELRLARPQYDCNDMVGLFSAYDRIQIEKDGSETLMPDFGEIHLCLPCLRVGIISHECGHAALSMGTAQQEN